MSIARPLNRNGAQREKTEILVRRRSSTNRDWSLLTFWLGLAGAFALYANNLTGGFLSDDYWWIDATRSGGPFAFWTTNNAFFRPQSSFEFWILDHLGHGRAWVFHAVVMLFFFGSAVLIRGLVQQLGRDIGNRQLLGWTATFSALIFALYPSHCEAVNWLSCVSDTAGMFEALTALILLFGFMRGTGIRRLLSFWGMAICFLLAMTSKEVFVCIPLLGLVLVLFGAPEQSTRTRWNNFSAVVAVSCALWLSYLIVHNLLQNSWGYPGQLKLTRLELEKTLTLDLPNLFLPFSKWIGRFGPALLLWPSAAVGIVFFSCVVSRCGTGRKGSGALAKWREFIAERKQFLFLIWSLLNFYFAFFWLADPVLGVQYVCLATLVVIAAARFKLFRFAWLLGLTFVLSCGFFVQQENLVLYSFFHLAGGWEIAKGKIAAAMVLFYFYATRPRRSGLEGDERAWLRIAALALLCAAILLLPGMTVSYVSLNGQGERFTFEASAFAAIAWGAGLAFMLGKVPRWHAVAGVAFVALLSTGLFFSNAEWAEAGRISNNVANELRVIASYNPRRIYLISSVAFCGEGQCLSNADELIARVACRGTTSAIRTGYQEVCHLPGDRVALDKADYRKMRFLLSVRNANYPHRLEPDELAARGSGFKFGWYEATPNRGEVILKGYERGDKVVYVDGEHLRVLL